MAGVLVYATADDYEAWTQADVPDNVDLLLRSASMLVRSATKTDFYDVDGAGKPSDAETLQAFKDATCALAASFAANLIDPAAGSAGANGTTGSVSISKLGTGQISYDTAGVTSQAVVLARMAAAEGICSEALSVLQEAGLATGSAWAMG